MQLPNQQKKKKEKEKKKKKGMKCQKLHDMHGFGDLQDFLQQALQSKKEAKKETWVLGFLGRIERLGF